MGYNEDFAEGRRNPGAWSNQPGADGLNDGAKAGAQAYEEAMKRAYAPKPQLASPQINHPSLPIAQWNPDTGSNDQSSRPSGGSTGDGTLSSFAKGGAIFLAVLFGGYALLQVQGHSWNWPQLGAGLAVAAVAGAVAGATFYIALKLLALALKAAFVLLGIGIVLHLLGTLNLFEALGGVVRWVRTFLGD